MYDIGWEVADRTRRLLDIAEGIRTERTLRDAATAPEPASAMPTDRPTAVLDCPPAERASRPRAA